MRTINLQLHVSEDEVESIMNSVDHEGTVMVHEAYITRHSEFPEFLVFESATRAAFEEGGVMAFDEPAFPPPQDVPQYATQAQLQAVMDEITDQVNKLEITMNACLDDLQQEMEDEISRKVDNVESDVMAMKQEISNTRDDLEGLRDDLEAI